MRVGSPKLLDQLINWDPRGEDLFLLLEQLNEVHSILVEFMSSEKS